MNRDHLKYMLLGGIGVFAVTSAFGLQLQTALLVAFVLACPLMMMLMMLMMSGGSGGAEHGASRDTDQNLEPQLHVGPRADVP